MDEMKIKLSTKLMRNLVSKLISKSINKKYGCKVNIHFSELDVSVVDGEASISASVDVEMESSEFIKIVKRIGLD